MNVLETVADFYHTQPFVRRYVIPFLGCAIVYFAYRKSREFEWHAIQNTAATIVIFWANLALIFLFFDEISAVLLAIYDWLQVPMMDPAIWDNVPFWLAVIFGIVIKDFIYYWCHRLMHSTWGWPAHAAHHSDTHVNAFTAYRIHFIEYFLNTCAYFLLLTWLQIPETIPFVVMLTALHDQYLHMDVPFTHGPFKILIASPAYHRWHHADVPEAYGKNLANIMPIWDRMFGTHYTYDVVPDEVPMGAVKTGIADKNPLMIYAYPILEWSRLVRNTFRGRSAKADLSACLHKVPTE